MGSCAPVFHLELGGVWGVLEGGKHLCAQLPVTGGGGQGAREVRRCRREVREVTWDRREKL